MELLDTIYIATLTGDGLVITGHSSGGGLPLGEPYYRFEGASAEQEQQIRRRLDEAYEQGLYGTGAVGEVRDMLFAMARAAETFKLEFKTPTATVRKAEEELLADEEEFTAGVR